MRPIDADKIKKSLLSLQRRMDRGTVKTSAAQLLIDIIQMIDTAPTQIGVWHDVKTELPKVHQDVIVCATNQRNEKRKIIGITNRWAPNDRDLHLYDYEVTHWMEIPEIPLEGDTEP